MKVLNLETGKIEDRVDPFEGQREQLEQRHSFVMDDTKYAGYCITCNKPVLWEDRSIHINKICGHIRVDVSHRRCL